MNISNSTFRTIITVFVLWLAGLTAAAQFAKFAVLFPDILALYPTYGASVGFLVSLISLLGIVFGLFAGMLVAHMGYKRLLIAALVLGAALSLYQSTLPGFELMLVSRILEGISHLIIVVSAPTLIAQIAKGRFQGFAMTLWSTFFGVAFALVAWLGIPVAAESGPGPVFLFHGVAMMLVATVLFVLLPSDRSLETSDVASPVRIFREHCRAYASPSISAAAWGWLFYTLTFVSLLTVLPTIVPAGDRSFVAGLMPLASIAVALFTGAVLLQRMTAVSAVVLGFVLSIGILMMLWMGAGLSVFAIVVFGALGLVQGASFAAIPQLNPNPEDQALANGALAQMGNLGNTLGTPVFLALLSAFGVNGLIIGAIVLYVCGIGMHLLLAARRKSSRPF